MHNTFWFTSIDINVPVGRFFVDNLSCVRSAYWFACVDDTVPIMASLFCAWDKLSLPEFKLTTITVFVFCFQR